MRAGSDVTADAPMVCSAPRHCPCGCGAHMGCFIYPDEDPPTGLELAYARAMNARLGLEDFCG